MANGGGSSAGGGGADEEAAARAQEEEMAMMAAMGFPVGFDSTQGKGVDDKRCKAEGVRRKEKRVYRQCAALLAQPATAAVRRLTRSARACRYMNRRGGFNRPLDEV